MATREINFEECFIKNSLTTQAVIRKYVVRHNLIPYQCEICGNDGNWQGKVLTLQLDHKNGINNDHRLENLRWLCPNCHSQTASFTGRNKTDKEHITFTEEQAIEALKNTPNVNQATKYIGCSEGGANWTRLKAIKNKFNILQSDDLKKMKSEEKIVKKEKQKNFCNKCGKQLTSLKAKFCQTCLHENQKRCDWPTREELKQKIRAQSFCQIGKDYNVSDNAIRKWCDNYKLPRTKQEINQYTDKEWEKI